MTTDEIAALLQDFLPDTPRDDLKLLAEICSYQSFKDKETFFNRPRN